MEIIRPHGFVSLLASVRENRYEMNGHVSGHTNVEALNKLGDVGIATASRVPRVISA